MQTENKPMAQTGMLIRKPIKEVFDAFINPTITTKFWFTKSSGKLEEGKEVKWTWEMYNVSTPVRVKTIELNQRIVIEWGYHNDATTVEWTFQTFEGKGTFVEVKHSGFTGTPAEILAKVSDSTGGFSLLIAGAKAYLEHHLQLNLVLDRHPQFWHK